LQLSPVLVHDESSVQEERIHRKGVHFVCDSTQCQLSATHRSAHQDVQGATEECLKLQQVLGFVKVRFPFLLYFKRNVELTNVF
jgi:hypothetical protein